MKPKALNANQPWIPSCWVGAEDGSTTPIIKLEDDSRRKYCAVKVNAAILRAMRHDHQN